MKNFLQRGSLLLLTAGALLAEDTSFWVEPCTNPETSCTAGDVQLARWAFSAWQDASDGRLHFVETKDRAHAQIRLMWSSPTQGLYGETVPIEVDGKPGAQIFVTIVVPPGGDALLRDTVVYLTCLHESGHALGLSHTRQFEDIMYSFQFGGDITEYFGRYRRKLATRDDFRKNSGMSPADRGHLLDHLPPKRP